MGKNVVLNPVFAKILSDSTQLVPRNFGVVEPYQSSCIISNSKSKVKRITTKKPNERR